MTMTKDEALKLALSTLDEVRQETFRLLRNGERLYSEEKVWDTIYEIKKALEKKDEPIAWGMKKDGVILDVICPEEHEREEGEYNIPLYTTTKRTWVGLTERTYMDTINFQENARILEDILKEKKMTYDEARKLMFEVFILNGMDKSVLMAVLEATKTHYFSDGFEWGFCGSAEGWNGEYPFHDKNLDPKLDEHYQAILKDGLDNTP